MLDRLKFYLLYGNIFCGIEHTNIDSEELIYVSILQKRKQSIDVLKDFKTNEFAELSSVLKKNQHATLVINTDKVLTKRVETSSKEDIQLVFSGFPNIKLDAFYYEINRQENYSFISICRKDYVEALINKYLENDIIITDFFLGNLMLSSICEFINQTTFFSANASIITTNNLIETIALDQVSQQIEYDINGLQTSNKLLLSLTSALNQIVRGYTPETNALGKKEALVYKLKQSQFFSVFLKSSLAIIFLALLINFFAFNHYFNNVERLQTVSLSNNDTNEIIRTLKQTVDSIEKTANDLLKSSASKSSYYINSIVQNLPESILLSDLNYQPILKNIKENEAIITGKNILQISGESNNSKTFSTWLSNLSKMIWITNVEIIDYNDMNTSSSNFNIKLYLRS